MKNGTFWGIRLVPYQSKVKVASHIYVLFCFSFAEGAESPQKRKSVSCLILFPYNYFVQFVMRLFSDLLGFSGKWRINGSQLN